MIPNLRSVPAPPVRPVRLLVLRTRSLLLALAGAVILLLAGAPGASAHAELQTTSPANGAVLDKAPATVSVQFTEGVQVTPDGLRVLAADGSRVDRGDTALSPSVPNTAAATLRSDLADGTYTVAWRATSSDSHPVHGAFAFTVGAPGSGTGVLAGADKDSDPLMAALVGLSRGAGYAGLALLIGATGILVLLARDGDPRRPRELAHAGAYIVFFSAVVSLLAQGPYAAGTGFGSVLDPIPLRETLSGRPGLAMLARVLLATAVLAVPELSEPRPAPSAAGRQALGRAVRALLPATAIAITFTAAGHAMTGRQIPVAVVVDIVHLIAMGLWLGGLVTLAVLCWRPSSPAAVAATIRRFSALALWCVAILVVTGVYQSQRQVESPDNLLTTEYGRLLVAKVTGVLVLVGLGYTARRWTQRNARPDAEPEPASLHRMRRTLAAEAVIGVVVLTLSTLLSGSAPARERAVAPAKTAAAAVAPTGASVTLEAHYDTGTGAKGTGAVTAEFVRKGVGTYDMDLRVTGSTNKPFTPAEVTATWSLPSKDLGPLPVELVPAGTGHWKAQARLVPTGDWLLVVKVRTTDIDEDSVTFATSNAALDAPTEPGSPDATTEPAEPAEPTEPAEPASLDAGPSSAPTLRPAARAAGLPWTYPYSPEHAAKGAPSILEAT